ncbi:FMN-dependent NADH-azoreductase [Mycoplasma struthionis]|uniref:FMN dependent NADH:quinone oxidoreductase n=1 Tax=Mycoplasma struthionis TaxID=538220 RepID=A0A502M292_9MOLU|nr:FMN-dependent NADH-azoreductase [Mycoplasma struthionis]TPI01842.1 FMN-dependent NADH-azoreductase [Mycoplasma struthionis]
MSKLIYIKGNVFESVNSVSNMVATLFLETYQNNHGADEIITLDLNLTEHANVFMNKNNFSTYFKDVNSQKWIDMLKEASKVVIALPMINFGPSATIKNFIDSICVPNETFTYKNSPDGQAIGMLGHLKVMIIATQGAPKTWYTWANHLSWLEGSWKFLGVKEVESIFITGTKVPPLNQLSPEEVLKTFEKEIVSKAKEF